MATVNDRNELVLCCRHAKKFLLNSVCSHLSVNMKSVHCNW